MCNINLHWKKHLSCSYDLLLVIFECLLIGRRSDHHFVHHDSALHIVGKILRSRPQLRQDAWRQGQHGDAYVATAVLEGLLPSGTKPTTLRFRCLIKHKRGVFGVKEQWFRMQTIVYVGTVLCWLRWKLESKKNLSSTCKSMSPLFSYQIYIFNL